MNKEAIENMFAELCSGDENIDILVLNAAYTEQGLAACAYSPEEMRQSFDTNVLGNMNLVRGFLGRAAGHLSREAQPHHLWRSQWWR